MISDQVARHIGDLSPYWGLLGMEPLEAHGGQARVRLPFRKEITQLYGTVHGGALASLADSTVALAIKSIAPDSEIHSTVEMKINFLAPARDSDIICEARLLKKGKRIMVGWAELKDKNNRLVATATATYIVNSFSP
ncbi:MAG: PaaI family thioesterase [Clostridia bacterium]|nr:PaaI family thioesterase [Clostridia bacterium]